MAAKRLFTFAGNSDDAPGTTKILILAANLKVCLYLIDLCGARPPPHMIAPPSLRYNFPMNLAEDIRSLRRPTELLAPAGRPDVLEAVIEAGADAVYLSGKRFQMRAHRTDFHFDDAQLREAVLYAHDHGRRIYVTMNTILGAHEIEAARDFLAFLDHSGVDAIIVCDLATIGFARELGVSCEVHASTMLNVHDFDQALVLKKLGIHRLITSRDISIQEAGRLGERSGLAVEYFLHGDMCVAQSGQCAMSGLIFGKSSNRGECMKPCRWEYELINLRDGHVSKPLRKGHLMALRDLALLRQIPALIEAGIAALKIEGRMRDAAYVSHVVRIYREALDMFYAMPASYCVTADALERLFRERVRDLCALACTGAPSHSGFFDISGKHEPLMLSNGAVEVCCVDDAIQSPEFSSVTRAKPRAEPRAEPRKRPDLAVCVASVEAAQGALDAGADRIYLAAETRQFGDEHWSPLSFLAALSATLEADAAVGIRTPRVSAPHAHTEWRVLVETCQSYKIGYVLVHHLGALRRARRDLPEAQIIADYGLNATNPRAVAELAALGAPIVTPGLEAGYDDVAEMAAANTAALELLVHGPMTGMLVDHCLIALNLSATGSKDACRGPCKHAEFALRDAKGEVRQIITDQYCRNHILTTKDLAVLPRFEAFLALSPASIRIEGQFYAPELLGRLVAAYRDALDRWVAGAPLAFPERDTWRALMDASPRPWNFGGYAQRIMQSDSTAQVMRAQR